MVCPVEAATNFRVASSLCAVTSLLLFDCECRCHKRQVLPEDFHVQTLFAGKPRVACTIAKTKVFEAFSVLPYRPFDPFQRKNARIVLVDSA